VRKLRQLSNLAALSLGAILLAILAVHYVFTAPTGEVLFVASAKEPDSIAATRVSLHSSAGWRDFGATVPRQVPAAPDSTTLWQGPATVGHYDRIRLGPTELASDFNVTRGHLTPVLIPVRDGQALSAPVYAGAGVSIGLNELAGNFQEVPPFSLIDQFNRPFTNASIAGKEVVVAAFHTSCHETCPLYTGLFLQLRKQLPASVMLVEVTTAPQEDTPDVLREYAGRVGASWTFATGSVEALTNFWAHFYVQLSDGDSHSSTLAIIDPNGFIRTFWQGSPDVGSQLPAPLSADLSPAGRAIVQSHGDRWGQVQVLDALRSSGGLSQPGSGREGPAPPSSLKSLDGRTVSLADLSGRPVLINFWASYCQPCRREMPLIEKYAVSHPQLQVLLVNERDDLGAAKSLVREFGIRSPVLLDPDGVAGDAFRVNGLPTSIFVGLDGSVNSRYIGEMSAAILSSHAAAIDS